MFPHFLWRADDEIQEYGGIMEWNGPLPPRRCFRKGRNSKEVKAEDDEWEKEAKNWWSRDAPDKPKWNFRDRARFYCHIDVEILRRAARAFRAETMDSSGGMDPFRYLTTPASSLAVYIWKDMREKTIPNYSIESNKLFRRGMHGGRTEATQFTWPLASPPRPPPDVTDFNVRFSPTEELHKIDVNSLYPSVEVMYRYPVGYPSKLWGKPVPDKWPKELWPPDPYEENKRVPPEPIDGQDDPDTMKEWHDYFLHEDVFAFLVVDVTPPTALLSPVLPVVENGKLKFTLLPGGALGQYAVYSPLLRRAKQAGYVIERYHGAAVWDGRPRLGDPAKFPQPEYGIWKEYVCREMKAKEEASGFPPEVQTPEQKRQYLRDYAAKPLNRLIGLRLEEKKMVKNEGKKNTAKGRLNNLWGKCTQNEEYTHTEIFTAEDADRLYNDFVCNKRRRIVLRIPLPDNMLEVTWKEERRATRSEKATMSDEQLEAREQVEQELPRSEHNPRPSNSLHAVIPGALVPMYGQLFMYDFIHRLKEQRCYMDTDSFVYRSDPQNPRHVEREIRDEVGTGLGFFKDELVSKDGSRKRVTEFRSGGPKNYLLLYQGGGSDSTVKGIQKGRMNAEYQAAFLRAKVIQVGLGLPDSKGPCSHRVSFGDKPARDREHQRIYTKRDAFRTYNLVNDKLELFPDGSTLPYGHELVEAKRAFFHRPEQKKYWMEQLQLANRLAEEKSIKQDEWEGKPPGMLRHEGRKRRAEADGKDEKKGEAKRARVAQAGDRLRREEEKEAHQRDDLDDEKMEDVGAARQPRPDPAVFEGLMEVD
jgi:hypothetical protein